jgi:hypothetical protein
MWVIYDSWTGIRQHLFSLLAHAIPGALLVACQHRGRGRHLRWPCSSTLAKQLSVILRRSSSKRSARDMPDGVELELLVDGGPLAPPVDGRLGGPLGSPRPLG